MVGICFRLPMASEKIAKVLSFEGLISAPFTAFKPNGEINEKIIPDYVEHLVKNGVKGVFVNGTTGEGLSLTVEERKSIAEGWVKAGKGKLELIIIQVGANSIKDAQELARHAESVGASGIASLPPLFYKPPSDEHLVAYFKGIADAAPSLPLMLYHIPSYSGVEIVLAEFLPKARAAIPTFCGAKFTSTDVRDLLKCHTFTEKPFKLLSGFDEVLLPCLACGVTAAVGASYNFMAPISLRVLDAFKKGDIKGAREIQNRVLKAVQTLARHGQGIACFKAAMNLVGPLDVGAPRLPLVPLTAEALSQLKEDLKTLKAEEWSRI
ncbi:N-acetylneuraminate lyase-like [Stegodyphus dumicola]|uniref:N-acetylneuraminate lyase-like n=1 Tax=Stegodyphus dumicola TaxID=202533 RepID=UPI0015A77F0B|nr:N-acetylneuraminate lyase-like [Stegodyphus dumicola]